MKKTIAFLIINVCLCTVVLSQDSVLDLEKISALKKIEQFIISKQLDSALINIPKEHRTVYENVLFKLSNDEKLSYKDYNTFITNATNNNLDYYLISAFINQEIKPSESKNDYNQDYALIKRNQVSKLRDNGNLDEAATENELLEKHINKLEKSSKEFEIQKAYVNIHGAVLSYIERDIETGKNVLNKCLAIAIKYNDKELEIASLFYLSDFLVEEGKLDEYIEITEKSLVIEEELPKRSPFYIGSIQHLVNAYIFKGGYDTKIEELLDEVYNSAYKVKSYSLYAEYLSSLNAKSQAKQNIYKKFGVNNAKEFCHLIRTESKPLLNDNKFYLTLIRSSRLLERDYYLNDAIRYQEAAVRLTKKIYGEDLSKSLANYKTKLALKEKEIEIAYAKERSKLYRVIAFLIGISLLVSLFVLRKFRKQSQLLKTKNEQINKTLKEKELLVKEVHHRVKNNFQIVSSLLELQSKGIEDEKALALANEGQTRVKSMALIHQRLYQNEDGLIHFDEYIHTLVKELTVMYATDKKVETTVSSKNMMFDVDTAIPLGLIINELITNAYKYAFKDNETNILNISISKLNKTSYTLTVSDNGKGLDPAFDIKKAKSLGLRLVNRLVKQLQGSLALTNNNGANFEIIFKDIQERRQIE